MARGARSCPAPTWPTSSPSSRAADLTLAASVDEGIVPGRSVWLVVKAAQVVLYPR
ncbi:hypothetical protein [Propioniciclava sinopodophylli]|uniref:hypothetical protein n=1 Tax=Propioniciclava sinopodophylli TaxID=1837344 RepID=UPI002493C5C5|nr:hypothetical protein [Propioniciclava sinopodophylli]